MAELNDPAPKYWVRRREAPETRSPRAGAFYTGLADVYYDAMVGDKPIGTYRAAYYGGERYAQSQAEAQVEKARIQAAQEERRKRQARAARYAAQGGGQKMSATDEVRTRYATAIDNIVDAITNINGAKDDLETARSNAQGELNDSNDHEAASVLEALTNAEEALTEANVQLAAGQQFLENVKGRV